MPIAANSQRFQPDGWLFINCSATSALALDSNSNSHGRRAVRQYTVKMSRSAKQLRRKKPPSPLKESEADEGLTLGEYLAYLTSGRVSATDPPDWPPDLFAISTAILQKSGAYHHVIGDWPPQLAKALTTSGESRSVWAARMRRMGLAWRFSLKNGDTILPLEVKQWWRAVWAGRPKPLQAIGANNLELCAALVQMAAVTDEACVGFGLPGGEFDSYSDQPTDDAFLRAQKLLVPTRGDPLRGSTLGERIHYSKVRVLPKLHTTRTGLTIRSLSQYLSLCTSSEIVPNWCRTPVNHQTDLNLLLVPWPEQIKASQFSDLKTNLPGRYGLFAYAAERIPDVGKKLEDLLDRAQHRLRSVPGLSPRLDGVVLPELALTPEDFSLASKAVSRHATFLVSGVAGSGHNCVNVDIWQRSDSLFSLKQQNKHHRWQLESSQITNYGLSAQLKPDHRWWEATALDNRTINFVPLFDWLTLSVLICEDLARPDPVGDLLRAVGPNLVIALLMDGPQKDWRWSARYATALADDPGSSVLTLTSAGMVRRYQNGPGPNDALEIGCWKDVRQGRVQPIALPPNAEAVVLHIEMELDEEWTADGRGDNKTACYPVLKRAVPIGAGPEVEYPIPN